MPKSASRLVSTAPPTAAVADACLRLGLDVVAAPFDIRPLIPGQVVAGPVRSVHHVGSVDVFLEACEGAEKGDILVVDNDGRVDEGCLGDLSTLELQAAGFAGVIIWGAHRDTAELHRIGLPLWSMGARSQGPNRQKVEKGTLDKARLGPAVVSDGDWAFADDDGVLFVPAKDVEGVKRAAAQIVRTERAQADRVRQGSTLRDQFQFRAFLEKRKKEPTHTLRAHLRTLGGEIEQ